MMVVYKLCPLILAYSNGYSHDKTRNNIAHYILIISTGFPTGNRWQNCNGNNVNSDKQSKIMAVKNGSVRDW